MNAQIGAARPQPYIPATLQEALDPNWLAFALEPVSGGSALKSVEVAETIKTMASKVRIKVRFENDPQTEHAFCLKAFLDAENGMGGPTTIREGLFYLDLAPHTSMRTPKCANVLLNRVENSGILVMNDLVAEGARFCSALEPFDANRASQSLEQLARLHVVKQLAHGTDWLPCRIDHIAARPVYPVELINQLLADPRGVPLDRRTRDAGLLYAAMRALAQRNAQRPQALLHGDVHAGNLYWTQDGPGFTDWQLVSRGDWAFDVAYHIAAVLPVEIAEREERRLLDHYLDTVRSLGGQAPDRESAWADYRMAPPYGFYHWAITQRVVPEITNEFTRRLGASLMRHESYKLLGL